MSRINVMERIEEWDLYWDEEETKVFEHHTKWSDDSWEIRGYNKNGDLVRTERWLNNGKILKTHLNNGKILKTHWKYEQYDRFRIVIMTGPDGRTTRFWEETAGLAPDRTLGRLLMVRVADSPSSLERRQNPLLMGYVSEE